MVWGNLHSGEFWEGSLDGHSKAPRVVDYPLNGTRKISLIFPSEFAAQDTRGKGSGAARLMDGPSIYMYACYSL